MRRDPESRARRARRRRLRRALVTTLSSAVVVAGLVVIWPQSLGGRIAYVKVSGHSMEPTLHLGDLVAIRSQSDFHRGDVVAYHVPAHRVGAGAIVIHRIVGGDARHGFTTRGDNNSYDDPWRPRPAQIVGARWVRIPGVADLFGRLRGPLPVAAFAALVAMLAAAELLGPRRRASTSRATRGGAVPRPARTARPRRRSRSARPVPPAGQRAVQPMPAVTRRRPAPGCRGRGRRRGGATARRGTAGSSAATSGTTS